MYVFPKKVTLVITAKQTVQYRPAASLHYSTTQFVVGLLCCVSLRHEIYNLRRSFSLKGLVQSSKKKPKKKEIITAL